MKQMLPGAGTFCVLGFLAVLSRGGSVVAQPIITEFMASNASTLDDDDGESSDWIEIYNPDASPVSLLGYALTNEAAIPRKWLFPDVTILPGGFVVVFASEKDRRDPAAALHTNFRLPITGGFLALTAPGGAFVTSFDPFPLQETDFSYGFTQNATYHQLLEAGAPALAIVPPDGSLGLTWTQTAFSTAGWTSGRTGIGYDRNPDYGPLIQLDLRSAMDGGGTSAYIRVPFTVADPADLSSLFLGMKYDDGFIAYVNGRRVAERNEPATPAWNSAATTLHDDAQAVILEEINISEHVSALRAGSNVLAIHGLNESATSSDFLILPELLAIEAGAPDLGETQFFAVPSPGWANTTGFAGISVPPRFSMEGATFTTGFSLTLSSPRAGTAIRYTLDRSVPTAASTLYTAPIPLSATTVVRARAFEPGLAPSKVVSEVYTFLDATTRNVTSNLPLVVINTFGQGVGENAYTTVYAHVIDTAGNGRSALAGLPQFTGTAALKIRGSSSLGFPKRSFNFEVRDEAGDDLDVSLLGMPAESDWVLYAPYTDKTLMRDVLAYEWSNDIGRYAPRTRFVELYMGGGQRVAPGDYQGVYVLEEKIKRGADRVDITELHPSDTTAPDVTGGYLLKVDRLDPGDSGFSVSSGLTIAYVDPKEEDITPAQRTWIRNYMNQFEAALFSASFRDPVNGYRKYIDLDSWVDHFLLVELTKNIDGYRLSTFFHKDRDDKLVMGPAWDYNLCLGNADYLTGWDPAGWYVDQLDFPWWDRLMQDPDFVQRFIDRWTAFRAAALSRNRLLGTVDVKVALLGESQARNYQKWPILGSYVWPNWYIGQTYSDEINFMKGWITNRLTWIDNNYAAPPSFNQNGGPITPGFVLSMGAPIGPIYYTLDGSDPRRPGGTLLPGSLTYSAPFELHENTRVLARTRTTKGWSALTAATFYIDLPPLLLTEIMYHAADPGEDETGFGDNDFEFIEIRNAGTDFADLRGVKLAGAVQFDFTGSGVEALGPGEYAVLVENLEAFETRYDTRGILIAGEYSGDLGNSSEEVLLEGPVGEPIQGFTYRDAWYPETDGGGWSLVLVNPDDPRQDMGTAAAWQPSLEVGGSPGRPDTEVAAGRQIPGDGNQDGSFDLSDPLFLLNFLFGGTVTELPCDGGGNQLLLDLNGSEGVDISDAVFGLLYLFAGGGPPALGADCTPIAGCPDACAP
jgi:hypothetical protein